MKKISLPHMREKQKGRIVEIGGGFGVQQRLMGMNIYIGKEVAKLSHFAARGPVTIKVGRAVMALGHGIASKIFVETE